MIDEAIRLPATAPGATALWSAEPGRHELPPHERLPDEEIDAEGQDDPEHEGGTEGQVGDRTGPGAGYDKEPEQTKDKGGVAPS